MKRTAKITTLVLYVTMAASIVYAGSLNPSTPPTAGTMKPLDQIEPRTAVQSLTGSAAAVYVISQPGSYYLTAGITVTEIKHAISIETSNVTLDLSGFKITGAYDSTDSGEIPAYDGIHINPGYKNIIIRNGIIEGQRKTRRAGIPPVQIWFYTKPFSRGIAADWDIVSVPGVMSQSVTVENVTVQGNLTYGIYLRGKNHLVTRCNVANNEGPGIHAGFPSTVKDNHQSGNGDNMLPIESGPFAYQNASNSLEWVNLPDFYMAKYETTNAQYCDFLNEADGKGQYFLYASMGITRSGTAGQYTYAVNSGKDAYPIQWASAYDAEAYAKWKSRTTGQNYRLPTEQEWEKAAGWNPVSERLWMYGFQRDTIDTTWCNYNNAYSGPLPVGSFNGTGGKNDAYSYYGCYDMSGNIYEWTSSPLESNPRFRVLRGGYYGYSASGCAVTYAINNIPTYRNNDAGFRLVLDPN